MSTQMPEIARKITPGQCRELLEFLLGGPLKRGKVTFSREVVDHPTDEQRKQDHVPLSGGRIMLSRSRAELHFETDWQPHGRLSAYEARVVYMGAISDGKILRDGSPADCRQRWSEILDGAGTPVTAASDGLKRVATVAGVGEIVRTVVEPVGKTVVEHAGKVIEHVSNWFPGN